MVHCRSACPRAVPKCHTLLERVISENPDPAEWMDLLGDLESVITAGERVTGKKEVP